MAVKLPRAVIALAIVSLLTDVSSEMVYPLLPVFLREVLGAGALAVGAIEGAAESVASLLKLASGWWSDRARHRKPLVVLGYLLATMARPLIGLAGGVGQVAVLRLTDRAGKGVRTAPRDALIADAVQAADRGRAFGLHRAADNLGAVIGPLLALLLLREAGVSMRWVFVLSVIPALLAVVVLVAGVGEGDRGRPAPWATVGRRWSWPERRFGSYLAVLMLFTLGNSSDAFLLLRATDAGVGVAWLPLLWALLSLLKAVSSLPAGILSDRVGRRPVIVGGWVVYAAVYFLLGRATTAMQVWLLFAVYGVYFGLTEGVEKALVADLASEAMRGTAFGWYNLVVGLGALPASLLFGAIWEWRGATVAFDVGAGLALAAAVGLGLLSLPSHSRRVAR